MRILGDVQSVGTSLAHIETGLGPDLLQRLAAGSVDLVLTKRAAGHNPGNSLCRKKLVWVGRPGIIEAGNDIIPPTISFSKHFARNYPAHSSRARASLVHTIRERKHR